MSLSTAISFAHEKRERFFHELVDICTIPSVSTDPDHKEDILRTAKWLESHLKKIGMDRVEIIPTEGHPIVYAENLRAGKSARTVLVYGHYDVQPAEGETLEAWHSEPFTPTQRGDNLFARGTTDMKAQILAALNAIEALNTNGGLPVNVKFMLEGEEEIGSPHLEGFIDQHRELLACDIFLNPDTGMMAADQPSISYGLRGLAAFELVVHGPKKDLHSGSFGGVVHNPAAALCKVLGAIHDEKNRVTLPGFYEKVRELHKDERAEIARMHQTGSFYLDETGVKSLWGEEGYTPEERVGARPTFEINGLYSGYIGEGAKTVLPAYAMAKITCRLVPDQDPDEVAEQFREFLKARVPDTVTWELKYNGGSPGSVIERQSHGIQAISRAFEQIWKKTPLFKREGGSVPVVLMAQKYLNADVVNTGFSLPEDSMHGPDEKIHLPTWEKGIDVLIHFFNEV